MEEETRRWLVTEVERLRELNRAHTRRMLKRGLLILLMLAAAFAVGWYALPGLAERLISEILPYGLGLMLVRRPHGRRSEVWPP